MNECKNADCGKCKRCLDEFDDPVGCKPIKSIEFEVYCLIVIVVIIFISLYLIFKK